MQSQFYSILLDIEGMKCGGCVKTVEQTLLSEKNVLNASVNLVKRTALVDLKDEESIDQILNALSQRGFPAKQRVSEHINTPSHSQDHLINRWWSQWKQLMIALSLLLLSVLSHLAESKTLEIPILGSLIFHASLASFAIFGPGQKILKSGLKSAWFLTPNMDTLVGIGVLSAYFTSLSSLIWPDFGWPCFFNEPVMLLGFVLLGRFLEERARFRTNKALQELAKLQPDKARLLINENQTQEIRVGALKLGEKIQLLAGDRNPIDGIVVEGNSYVDNSSITGESIPINAIPGQELLAGSLNLDGTLTVEVTRIGKNTSLARIIGLVEQSQTRKAPIQSLADQVAGKFCYGVVSLSVFTFFFWWKIGSALWPNVLLASGQGLINTHHNMLHSSLGENAQTPIGLAIQLSIAVLVIACPCALGLATPTVITVASGQAAKRGWLFKGGDVIQKASEITQIIFDKTGTLTIGRPKVIGYLASENDVKLIQIAASIEQNSRHPIAHAILQKAIDENITLLKSVNIKTIPGKGILGELNNIEGTVRVGQIKWIKEEINEFNSELEKKLDLAKYSDQSIVGVSINKSLLGLIIIDDQLRKDVGISLSRLRSLGFNLKVLSGDRERVVIRIGKNLGFEESELGWELMPEDKLKHLENFKKNGRVAMVGDGINDAPALAASDLGVSIGTGTQIAQETSDLIIMGDRLESLPDALLLSKKTIEKVKQNLFWAFGYNIIALPIAAGILLPRFGILLSPPIAALLMATSSITVVINSLTLQKT